MCNDGNKCVSPVRALIALHHVAQGGHKGRTLPVAILPVAISAKKSSKTESLGNGRLIALVSQAL